MDPSPPHPLTPSHPYPIPVVNSHTNITRTLTLLHRPFQSLLPEVPKVLVQENKVSGAVINAFDAHIHALSDTLLTKLDTVERLAEEAKRMERMALKPPRRKSSKYLRYLCYVLTSSPCLP